MTSDFTVMLDSFMCNLLGINEFPSHAHTIATLSLTNGGLGLQHPRLNAIPSLVLSIKRAITYAIDGIFLPNSPTTIRLPTSITTLYDFWHEPRYPSHIFTTFNKYLQPITATTIDNHPNANSIPDSAINDFVYRTSIPWAREQIKHHAGNAHIRTLLHSSSDDVLHAIPGLLRAHMSLPLVAMSRTSSRHRLDNQQFNTALRCKLRIGIYHNDDAPICYCGKKIDKHVDHYFTCGEFKKTRCSNMMRDETCRVMKRIGTTHHTPFGNRL